MPGIETHLVKTGAMENVHIGIKSLKVPISSQIKGENETICQFLGKVKVVPGKKTE